MTARTLSRDPLLQKVVRFHDLHDGQFAVETVYDAQQVKDANTVIRNAQPAGWKGHEHLVARLPMPLFQQLRSQGIVQDPKAWAKWLNDPDNAIFRTKTGRI
jgi:hypothetical protein